MDSNIEVINARNSLLPYLQQGGIYTGLLDALDHFYRLANSPVEPTQKYLTLRDAISELKWLRFFSNSEETAMSYIETPDSPERKLTIAFLAYNSKLITSYGMEKLKKNHPEYCTRNYEGFWKLLTDIDKITKPIPSAIILQDKLTQSKSEIESLHHKIEKLNKRVEQLEQELKEKTSELKKAQNKIIEQEDKLKGFDSVFNFDKILAYARFQRNIDKPCDQIHEMLIDMCVDADDTVRAKKAKDEKNKKKEEDPKVINNYNQISGSNVFTGVVNAQQGPSDNQKRLRR